MEKKAKIIATLGPAIHSENKLKAIVNAGVDAFRINFSHNISEISKIVTRIRKIENVKAPKIAIDYWNLPLNSTLKDVIKVVRDDEAGHRDVNHGYANILNKKEDPNEDQLQV